MTYAMYDLMFHRAVTSVELTSGTAERSSHGALRLCPSRPQACEGRGLGATETSSRQPAQCTMCSISWRRHCRRAVSPLKLAERLKIRCRFPGREVSDDRLSYCKKTVHYFTIPYFKPHYRVSLAVVPCLDERFVRRRFHGSFGQTFACRHLGALSRFVDRFRSVPERRGRVSARQNRRSRSRREGEDYGQPHPSIEGHHNQRSRLFPNRQYCSLDVHHPN